MSSGEKFITENYEQLMINCLQVKSGGGFFTYLFNFYCGVQVALLGGIVNT